MKPAGDERTPDGGEHAVERPAREQLLTVRRDEYPGALVLTVSGEVDGLTVTRLRHTVAEAFADLDGRVLVLDLVKVAFLGSPGLRMLFDSAAEAVHHRGLESLRVVVDNSRPVIRPIQIVGLDSVLALYEDVAAALAV